MSSHHQLLGVPADADRETIKHEYLKRRAALEKSARIPEEEKASMLADMDNAYRALNPKPAPGAGQPKAAPKYESDAAAKPMNPAVKKAVIGLVSLTVLGGAGYAYWQVEENKRIEREQIELERIAAEKRAARLAEEERLRKEAAAREIEERRLAEEERLRQAQLAREEEMKGEKYVAGQTFVPRIKTNAELREEREARAREFEQKYRAAIDNRIDQIKSERETARAQAEVQRQQRFLDQNKREEELAAQQRARAALNAERREQRANSNPPR
jgi:hypothetical protein